MSGRVHVTLSDGRRVRGFRKTLRRQSPPRTPADEAPTLRLVFQVPRQIMLPAVTGVAKTALGPVEIGVLNNASITDRTFNRDRVLARAAAFLSAYTPKGHPPYSISAVLTSSSEPGWSMKWQLTFVDGHVTAALTPITPLVFPAAA